MNGNAKIKVVLFLLALIALAMLAIPFFLVPPGDLIVKLRDNVFNTDLSGKEMRLDIVSSGQKFSRSIRRHNEEYVAAVNSIKSGDTEVELHIKGYEPHIASVHIPSLESAEIEASLIPTFGRIKAFAINATNKKKLSAFNAKISSASQNASGGIQGAVLSELEPGNHKIELDASGFCPANKDVKVEKGKVTEVTLTMSPELSGNELARVILEWGLNPNDLDSHLFLPKHSSLKSRHVYYSNKKASFKNGSKAAELDVDDTSSYGPETVTISNKLKGTYQYAIYLYAGRGTLGRSQATVELVTNGCEKQKFSVPTNCNKKWWHVFNIKYNGSNIEVIRQDKCRTMEQMNWRTGKK
ncbi:YfaP family protein [Desulfonema magnum]|uniref:PEGA domain-containing protein n=1 Tax=Desulfonema magnum TaxID=45655 RepID=A0A975BJI3_9BACT|nr:PEGA domain-containing protein [Desulfonema magnum]QTA86528.1 Uncharacterized protein dnm_025520 [Desulfonema magnum]